MRSVSEWVGRDDDAKIPLLGIDPLREYEQGRGVRMPPNRLTEIRNETLRLVALGYKQSEIATALGATPSRLSRWCRQAVMETRGPLRLLKHRDRTLAQAMWDRIDVRGAEECWRWLGAVKGNGYGAFNYKGTGYNAHRLVYETLVGTIPQGLVLDHICSNPACVNPRHLQIVTQTENLMLSARRRA